MNTIPFIKDSFGAGLNQKVDPTRIGLAEIAVLVNGRSRYDVLQTINEPLELSGLPAGLVQGIYGAGGFLLVFIAGQAWVRNYNIATDQFAQIPGFQMSTTALTLFAQAVPASISNFSRVPFSDDVGGGVTLQAAIGSNPACVVVQDGESQPWVILQDGSARVTQGYAQWSATQREYVPIGRQMHWDGERLWVVSIDGNQLFRSISGRPLDFMVNITSTGDKPADTESDGGAQTTSHRVSYDTVTCIRGLNDPEGAFFVGTLYGSWRVVPNLERTIWDEPTFQNRPMFPTGPVNQFSFVDVLGSNTFISLRGLRQFNASQTFNVEGRNLPFSAQVAKMFRTVLQETPAAIKFDDYALFAVETVYGSVVVIFDEVRNVFVGWDKFDGVESITQFAQIQTPVHDRLFFRTSDNKVYEYYGSEETAPLQAYVGDWVNNDPQVEQKPVYFKVVLNNPCEEGTVTITPFVDGERGTPLEEEITAIVDPESLPLEVPFGPGTADSVRCITKDIGRNRQGWKVGVLIELDCMAEITQVLLVSEKLTPKVSIEQQANNFLAFR